MQSTRILEILVKGTDPQNDLRLAGVRSDVTRHQGNLRRSSTLLHDEYLSFVNCLTRQQAASDCVEMIVALFLQNTSNFCDRAAGFSPSGKVLLSCICCRVCVKALEIVTMKSCQPCAAPFSKYPCSLLSPSSHCQNFVLHLNVGEQK